jgi:hypothetical protein
VPLTVAGPEVPPPSDQRRREENAKSLPGRLPRRRRSPRRPRARTGRRATVAATTPPRVGE